MKKNYLLLTGVALIAIAAAAAVLLSEPEATEVSSEALTGAAAAAAEDTRFPSYSVSIKDHEFDPKVVEIPAGQKIKLVIKNNDATPEEFESHSLNREKMINGGQEAIVYVGPLQPGEYKFEGELNPSTAQGIIRAK